MGGTFFGRDAEIVALESLCTQALEGGKVSVAVVSGAPGSGKTRLLSELRHRVERVISIAGYEPEHAIPLAAARVLLRELAGLAAGKSVPALSLAAAPRDEPLDTVQLFEAAHLALRTLGPLVVLVDDLQWADETSIGLLHYLLRAAESDGHALALVTASRPGPAIRFSDSLHHTLAGDSVLDLTLGPISQEAGVLLVKEHADEVDTGSAQRLWQLTGGSPLWMVLLAHSEHVDTDVDRLVTERLRSVDADGATMLAVLALVGRPLPLEDAAQIQDWPFARTADAVTSLERHGLAVQVAGTVSVTHDLIRQGATRTVPPDRRRRIRGRLGAWLEETAGHDVVRMLEAIEHLEAGGRPVNELATRVAQSPQRRLLGVAGMRRLAAIADRLSTDALFEAVATLASELGEHEEAFRLWVALASLGHDATAAQAALRASESAFELGRGRDAWLYFRRARASSNDPTMHLEALAHEAAMQRHIENRPDEARRIIMVAQTAAQGLVAESGTIELLDKRSRQAFVLAALVAAEGAMRDDDPEEMLTRAEELVIAANGFDDRLYIYALVEGAWSLRFLGRNLEAESRLRQAWDESQRRALPHETLEAGQVLAGVLLSMARVAEADAVVRQCVQMGLRLSAFRPSRAFIGVLPHLVELSRGEWRRGVLGLREAVKDEPNPHYRHHASRELATALARLDPSEVADVREAVSTTIADAEAAMCRRCLTEAVARCAESLARVGDSEAARVLLRREEPLPSDVHNCFWWRRARAVLAVSLGESSALVALEDVIAEAERQDLSLEALWARLDLATLLTRTDKTRAAKTLRAVGAEAEKVGARTEQMVAEQRLRALGVRTWRRGAAQLSTTDRLAQLSDREREIATLVASGANNREIAATVFLSRKTVERHVSNILAKSGVRNRAELAALAALPEQRRGAADS